MASGYLGNLQKRLEKAVQGHRRESRSGAGRQAHNEQAAEKMLKLGLKALGTRKETLAGMRKGVPEPACRHRKRNHFRAVN